MNATRWVGPACGVLAIVLIFGSFIPAGTSPEPGAPLSEVTSFYAEHDAGQLAAATLMSLGALLFLVFASTLVGALRSAEERSPWPTVCLCGGVLVVTGLLVFASLALALGDVAGDLQPSALQALHVLYQEFLLPLTIGVSAFMLGAGHRRVADRRARELGGLAGDRRGPGRLSPEPGARRVRPHRTPRLHGLGIWTLVAGC